MNKIKLIIILIFLSGSLYAQSWIPVNTPVNKWLNTLSFPDSLNAWAAGEDGVIIHSSDGGASWVQQTSPVTSFIYKMHFINRRFGWAVANASFGTGTSILSTTNGGANWSSVQYPDSTQYFSSVFFLDSLNGYLAGNAGSIVKTTNGGNSWTAAAGDSSSYSTYPLNSISMFSSKYGFACGGVYDLAGVIRKTTDNGNTWRTLRLGNEPLSGIYYFDSLNVIICGGDYELGAAYARTTNAGASWDYVNLNFFGIARAVAFRTINEGWMALSFAGAFAYTSNSGESWQVKQLPDYTGVYDVSFCDTTHGLAAGKNGKIFRYSFEPSAIKNETSVIKDFELSQNYPNPFNPSTMIRFYIPVSSQVTIKIYNALGQEVEILLNKHLTYGEHFINFNANDLPGGIYFYTLYNNGDLLTKKMLLLK